MDDGQREAHDEAHRWLDQHRRDLEQQAKDRRELRLRIVGALLTSLLLAAATLIGTALMVYLGIDPRG